MNKIEYRKATSADVPAIADCRINDSDNGPADTRIAAYLDGHHHPHQALPPRVAYLASIGDRVVGYIAGHRTERFGYDGELQYLYVVPAYRRSGIATALLEMLMEWFRQESINRVCVNVNVDSPAAGLFYSSKGAKLLNRHWYAWENITDQGHVD